MNSDVDRGEFEVTTKSVPGASILRCGPLMVNAPRELPSDGPTTAVVDGVLATAVPETSISPSTVLRQPG
jgi:hypothetical protein